MRLIFLAVPAAGAMICAGVALVVAAQRPPAEIYKIESASIKDAPVRHILTEEMMREAETYVRKPAPEVATIDVDGKNVVLGSKAAPRPQFVYFVLDGCPCSFDAEPLFHKLFKRFKGKIDFVSVTNGDEKKAKEWSTQMLVNYPVIPDPEKKIIHAYGAKASVYSALLSKDGHIIHMWPGYSADLLQDMNAQMAKAANVPETPFDPEYAPRERATGCAF